MFRNTKILTRMLVTLSMLLAPASAATFKAEAQKVINAWSSAFSEGNLEAILKSFAEDAIFLGTGSKAIVSTPAGIREYFQAALSSKGPKPLEIKLLTQKELKLADSSVLVVALDSIAGTGTDGKSFISEGRVTFLVAKRGAKWLIVHFHRSAIPN